MAAVEASILRMCWNTEMSFSFISKGVEWLRTISVIFEQMLPAAGTGVPFSRLVAALIVYCEGS